jgi:hypothetical protein
MRLEARCATQRATVRFPRRDGEVATVLRPLTGRRGTGRAT